MNQPTSDPLLNHTPHLLQKLEDLVLGSIKLPLSNKVILDEESFFEILDQLREVVPLELQQAQDILSQKDHILQKAEQGAQQIVEQTKATCRNYIQEHELVRQARELAEKTKREAEESIKKQHYEADKYSEAVLAELEGKVNQALSLVQSGRQNLAKNMNLTSSKIGETA